MSPFETHILEEHDRLLRQYHCANIDEVITKHKEKCQRLAIVTK